MLCLYIVCQDKLSRNKQICEFNYWLVKSELDTKLLY